MQGLEICDSKKGLGLNLLSLLRRGGEGEMFPVKVRRPGTAFGFIRLSVLF